jgi:hypothetical protein
MIRLAPHPHGPRLYVGPQRRRGFRVHHGPLAATLAATAWRLRRRRIAAVCIVWAATDWRDFPFRDCDNH